MPYNAYNLNLNIVCFLYNNIDTIPVKYEIYSHPSHFNPTIFQHLF